ncbi:MAG: bifunctional oligoribonuclease/PAP phosphatase NrnA [Cyclonatronaceae bacterium]
MIKKFGEGLAKLEKPGLISHIGPDGDAIGSQLALFGWFKSRGVEPLLFNDDPVPANLNWLPNQEKIRRPASDVLDQCDGFLFIDGNEPGRFGSMSGYFNATGKPVYLIDHHLDPPKDFYREMLWDSGASSTAYLVYRLFEETDPEAITGDVAEALYAGILTDTGSFRFDTVTAETHFAIARIIRQGGIRPSEIYSRIYDDKSLAEYYLLGTALKGIRLFCGGRVAVMQVSESMMDDSGCSQDDLEGFVNYPLSIRGVVVSVLMYERDGRIKMSLRGKSLVDLNEVARNFDGGGHFNAAGAWHDGPMEKAVDEVVREMEMRIRECEERD